MDIDEENYLEHYGILRRSGRYPWGSGGPEYGTSESFLGYVDQLKSQGLNESEIAKGFGVTTTQLRAARSIARAEKKQADINMAQRLKDKGYSNVAIGQRMGVGESSIRALLAPGEKDKADVLASTSNMLKEQVAEKKYLGIGAGVEHHIGVSQTKLNTAVAMLKEQGYEVHTVKIDQVGTGQQTIVKVLAAPGTTQKEVWQNRDNIKEYGVYSDDGGRTFLGIKPPLSISSKRIQVKYADQGGAEADGVMYVRPGVPDLSLGGSRYAQVRVAVDGTHYLKGMAMHRDDLPVGIDIVFNTNKHDTGNKLDAMKPMKKDANAKIDPDNPFGSAIKRQILSPDGKRVESAMNIVNEEGDWAKWSKSLSSQMLSKQSRMLASSQLDMSFERRKRELDDILSLTNPAVRRSMLESFAEDVDAAAVHLKAAALPKQGSHVILPIASMKENEVYAPNFNNGDRVVLIRYPHGGKFEIPELTVNNRQPEARKVLGGKDHPAKDAVGINVKVAQRLSGADFDGDTVLVIPNNQGKIKTEPALEGLKNFDPVSAYPAYPGMPKMTARTKGIQMGDVSNLITDMTIKGATSAELARAVRHSMVVIDAEKHNLNWRQSAIDNGIKSLKEKYQDGPRSGAATLISRAGSETHVPERKQGFRVDPKTGQKIYTYTNATKVVRTVSKRTGQVKEKVVPKTTKSTKLAEATDAKSLSSGTAIENIYADHSNRLKAMANEARRTAVNTKPIPYSPSARNVYAKQVADLAAKLNIAQKNSPLERQAQILANTIVRQKKTSYPEMDAAELKKVQSQALAEARVRTGAKKQRIVITDNEWHAIQAGAISNHMLQQILNHSDLDRVKELAMPRANVLMTSAKQHRAEQMLRSGYTQAEVADALGVSLSTLEKSIQNK